MKIVFGLGNPGEEYRGTRHNVGAEVVRRLAARAGIELKRKWRMRACVGQVRIGDRAVTVATSRTFMNLSGQASASLLKWNGCGPSDLLVVSDDIALDLGRLRIRREGGSGGHKGIESIIGALGTENFARLRIGVGRAGEDWVGHVLGKFSREEKRVLEGIMDVAVSAVDEIVVNGLDAAMNRFNNYLTTPQRGPLGE
jgi:PTH1 family peptidyl-tRNA hydrolase